ncbi:hypothetical protein [Acetobacter indonesiensis]|uniref:Uncharacterized protein n=2 Tax=Acetobacter indonesiensis TaxID=104101 RepID=A0A252ALQ8_9PROT|nr:hypothetical protein [Acetobacter indonesiensis]OUI90547.1 hypothetical protein HK17_13790 [Acetobacter indonesiensis]
MEKTMSLRKALWPALATGGLFAIIGTAFLPAHETRAVLFALSDATACLFQYDLTPHLLQLASR